MLASIIAAIGVVGATALAVVFYRADRERRIARANHSLTAPDWKGILSMPAGLLAVALFMSGSLLWHFHANERWQTCKITKLDRGTGSDYRVETSCGTFINVPAWQRFKSTADTVQRQEQMAEGGTYRLRTAGRPIPNIYEVLPAR